jgi:hypothetical protein
LLAKAIGHAEYRTMRGTDQGRILGQEPARGVIQTPPLVRTAVGIYLNGIAATDYD